MEPPENSCRRGAERHGEILWWGGWWRTRGEGGGVDDGPMHVWSLQAKSGEAWLD
jgi:hypothetical protein